MTNKENIKFFRKIRFELMKKNKTGKYIEYALGEIVLVVVVLLITFSINNWNDNNISNKEKALLIEIKTHLKLDLVDLNMGY